MKTNKTLEKVNTDVTFDELHLFGIREEFIKTSKNKFKLVQPLLAYDNVLEARLYKFSTNKKQKEKLLFLRVHTGNLLSFEINFAIYNYPIFSLYKVNDLPKSIHELTKQKEMNVYYSSAYLGSKVPKIFTGTKKDIARKKLIHKRSFSEGFDASRFFSNKRGKLHQVRFYNKSHKVVKEPFFKNADMKINHESIITHLSPNRTLSEFKPFFEPSLNYDDFFKKLKNNVSSLIIKNFFSDVSSPIKLVNQSIRKKRYKNSMKPSIPKQDAASNRQ